METLTEKKKRTKKKVLPTKLQTIFDRINDNSTKGIKARLRKLKHGGFTIYLDIHYNGKRDNPTLPLTLSCRAELKDDDERTLKELGYIIRTKEKELLEKTHQKGDELTDDVFLLDWFQAQADKIDNSTAPRTVVVYLRRLLKTLNKEKMLFSELDYNFCLEFAEYIKSSDLKINTKHNYFRMFKIMLKKAIGQGLLKYNPATPIKFASEETNPDFFTREEVQLLINTPTTYVDMKNAALMSIFTGLRISDIYKLRFSMIIHDVLNVRQTKTGGIVRVFITDDVEKILNEQRKRHQSDVIFHIHSNDAVNKQFKKWVKDAGISTVGRHLTYHSTRHTSAILMLDYMPIQYIAKVLGHKSITSTMRYQNIKNEPVKEALQKMPSFLTDKK